MTRKQYGGLIAAILFVGIMLAWVMWPAPNLDGLSETEKCQYSSYYRNRGGSPSACQKEASDAAMQRLMNL